MTKETRTKTLEQNVFDTNIGTRAHRHEFTGQFTPGYLQRDGKLYCSYCNSLHPFELVKLLVQGDKLEPADQKYGWPHKFYTGDMKKFYTAHLQDASPDEKAKIEYAMGYEINFSDGGKNVMWRKTR